MASAKVGCKAPSSKSTQINGALVLPCLRCYALYHRTVNIIAAESPCALQDQQGSPDIDIREASGI